ncbi:hypothetical protein C5S35_01670, partial [Candidatus Methanophagaceae archaeon]
MGLGPPAIDSGQFEWFSDAYGYGGMAKD